ncbi:MAG TPA: enoyl-CoA hydratase-related protein [Acidimicrobiales bacterium]|nr:enoyl-CoA hydratase-related protein [Acidimicrobiales bacterium]
METIDLGLVLYEEDGPIARIILNWPERANAQSSEMVHQFDQALERANEGYDVKVLIIKANGKGFCAGHAMGDGHYPEFDEARERWGGVWKAQSELFLWPILRLWEFPKPTIAQVHGYALGAGTYWALLPDITFASDDAYFQMPLVQGLGFPGGETMIEPWVFMNYKRAYEYLYTAQTLTAQQALEMGLVNRVVPAEGLNDAVEALAQTIAQAPLSTLMATKQLVSRAWELMGVRSHWKMSNDVMAVVEHMKDAREAREHMFRAGQMPRDAARHGGPPRPGIDVPPSPGADTPPSPGADTPPDLEITPP